MILLRFYFIIMPFCLFAQQKTSEICCGESFKDFLLVSPNGKYAMSHKGGDGVYIMNVATKKPTQYISPTRIERDLRNFNCVMQADGNFVIYDGKGKNPCWSSRTNGYTHARLALQDDGNLVVYASDNAALWSAFSGTLCKDNLMPNEDLIPNNAIYSKNKIYKLVYQDDGNLVIYKNGQPIWATNTNNKGTGRAIMQGDGNLVIYTLEGKPIWASNTSAPKFNGSRLVMQDDGNLVIYMTNGKPAWASNTNGK
jgi:hypothetical protein